MNVILQQWHVGSVISSYLNSRPDFFEVIFWMSLVLVALIIATLFYLVIIRFFYWRRLRLQQLVRDRWTPVFRSFKESKPLPLPSYSLRTQAYVLELWADQRALADKSFASHLDAMATAMGFAKTIESILLPEAFGIFPKKVWLQDIAISAARWLDTPQVRKSILLMTESDDLYLALRACLSLSKLRVAGYEQAIITLIFRFPEQTSYISSQLSREGGSEILLRLEPFLDRLPSYTILNFISLAERSNEQALLPLLEARMQRTSNTDELAAILRSIARLGGAQQRALVTPYISHPNLYLRIQAVKALGRIGDPSDVEALVPSLSSPEWWLRYRSARAIIKLTGRDRDEIDNLKSSLSDPYAVDILEHAYAELEWQMI